MSTKTETESIRLNRFLAQLGVASRRACDDLIKAGKVRVDGKRVVSPATQVVPGRSSVAVDGVKLDKPARTMVLIFHKPTGVVSTVSDPQGRPTVIDFCKRYARRKRLFPVGRLDVNTTGALPRTYMVRVRGGFSAAKLESLRRMAGVKKAESGSRASVELVKRLDKVTILKITLVEGRNRQVRNMCDAVGLHVVKLKRTNFGPLSIRNLPLGSVRPLTPKELDRLSKITSAQTGANKNGP
jgi:23S rRNA pseudouridine2605 synthase